MQNTQPQNPAAENRPGRTERQREASRRNGALSRGPVTATGKCRASANSRRHGLYSKATLAPDPAGLGPCDTALLAEFRAALQVDFGHCGPAAQPLIECAARALLGTRRVLTRETQILNEEAARQQTLHPQESPASLIGIAFRRLADETGTLDAILRLEGQFARRYERAMARLARLRRKSEIWGTNPAPPAQEQFLWNEPGAALEIIRNEFCGTNPAQRRNTLGPHSALLPLAAFF